MTDPEPQGDAQLRSDETRRVRTWIIKNRGHEVLVHVTVSCQKVGSETAVLAIFLSITNHLASWIKGGRR